MAATSPLRIGLIGCGGRIRGVAKHLLDSPLGHQVAITAMFDPHEWAVQETQTYLGTSAQVYPSLESLLRDSDVDWVMIGSWNCLVAPPQMPADRVAVLNAALARVFARADERSKLVEMGIEPLPLGTDAYAAHVKSEKDKWARVVKAAGTRLD